MSYNPIMSGMAFSEEVAMVGGTDEFYDSPDQFNEVWNHPDTKEREHWREAIKKEFNNMIKRKVGRQTRMSEVPENRRTIVVCVYIDDTLCAGTKEAIQEFKREIKKHFAIKEEGEMKEYVGCKVKRTGEKSLIMFQDVLINKIERIFGKEANKLQVYGEPIQKWSWFDAVSG